MKTEHQSEIVCIQTHSIYSSVHTELNLSRDL